MKFSIKKLVTNDWFIVTAITLLIALPRLYLLDQVPQGLHGDEGWTGIDAIRILNEGFIEPYIGSALGQLSGPLYFTALIFKLFGISTYTLRLSMVLLGIFTIPAFYFFTRLLFSKGTAILTTLFFGMSLIHIHYSRIALMLISAPFMQVLGLYFFEKFRKTEYQNSLILSAVFFGLGMYTYNTFFLVPFSLFCYWGFRLLQTRFEREVLRTALLFTSAFLFTTSPLLAQVINTPEFVFQHHKTVSVTGNLPWEDETPPSLNEKAEAIVSNGVTSIQYFFTGSRFDGGDGFGEIRNFHVILAPFFTLGGIIALKKQQYYVLSFLITLTIPAFFTLDGFYRRQIITLIPLYVFAGLAIEFLIKKLETKPIRVVSWITLSMLVTVVAIENIDVYFNQQMKLPYQRITFVTPIRQAITYIESHKHLRNDHIILVADMTNCEHEAIRFIHPEAWCTDGPLEDAQVVEEFSKDDLVFVLADHHADKVDLYSINYPGGQIVRLENPFEGEFPIVGASLYILTRN